jgi:neutral trehalase
MNRATKALEELWDEEDGVYYSRNFITREPIKTATIATLAPLYAGTVSKKRAKRLVKLLVDKTKFGARYPVPTVPLDSPFFSHRRYWQGPVWLNTNWLIYDGLVRYGFAVEAEAIRLSSLELVAKSGAHEYFSPKDGFGAGIEPFSWTAALTIEFANSAAPKK